MLELYTDGSILAFDGRILEYFRANRPHGVRRHIAHIDGAELRVDRKGRGSLHVSGKTAAAVLALPVQEHQFEEVAAFAAALSAAARGNG